MESGKWVTNAGTCGIWEMGRFGSGMNSLIRIIGTDGRKSARGKGDEDGGEVRGGGGGWFMLSEMWKLGAG